MRILFDQGTPVPLRRELTGHTISTVHELGWSQLENGALIAAATASFDLLLTTDQNMQRHRPDESYYGETRRRSVSAGGRMRARSYWTAVTVALVALIVVAMWMI
ncbi:MAG TPA: hypothetical protein VGR35_22620 [Tepidisphaeraceae bacterium]|nr:hypothetical protein [Tepidisphaeraceae bacterium]